MTESKWQICLCRKEEDTAEQMLEISEYATNRLISCAGLDGVQATPVVSEYANKDGVEYLGCSVGGRKISLVFETLVLPDAARRDALVRFFLPGQNGVLSVDRGMGKRYIDYRMGGAEFLQETLFAPLRVKVDLFCPDPWFYGEEQTSATFDQTVPLLTFPFVSLKNRGLTAGYRTNRPECMVKNYGDCSVGFAAKLKVTGGVAQGLYLALGDKKIALVDDVLPEDVVEISNHHAEKYVHLNGMPVDFDRKSEFFSIPKGKADIRIGYQTDSVNTMVEGTISFRPLYLGA